MDPIEKVKRLFNKLHWEIDHTEESAKLQNEVEKEIIEIIKDLQNQLKEKN